MAKTFYNGNIEDLIAAGKNFYIGDENNISRKVKKIYVGDENGLASLYYNSYTPELVSNFADNSWEAIIWACQNNVVPSTWSVGNQKDMIINGVSYPIDIIGQNHDTYTAGGTAPLTFQMHNCYNTIHWMSGDGRNTNGWTKCQMRHTYLPAILALMPSEVRTSIKAVNKKTSDGNTSTSLTTTSDTLFLLSEIEVFGKLTYAASGEGSQYAYYSAGNSKIKTKDGSAYYWYCRSPSISDRENYVIVSTGGTAKAYTASYARGVAPAFCF